MRQGCRVRAYPGDVDATAAATLGGLVGLTLGLLALIAVRLSDRQQRAVPELERPVALQPGVVEVLALLRSITIVVDAKDAVTTCSSAAMAHGLVHRGVVVHPELTDLVHQVRRDGVIREADLELPRGPMGSASLPIAVRVAPLGRSHVLLLVEDRSKARQIEEVRRDFVANVSHELKTPVGGIALLGEAILDAHDDADAVERFAVRIVAETERLSRLVQEIIDLSRLEMAHTLNEPRPVDMGEAAREALDRSRLSAESRAIRIAFEAGPACVVFGERELLVTAIRNLVGNAVAYSDAGTTVTVVVARDGGVVTVTVSDEGHGIPAAELPRIFERFYRVDAARSRATGGTGLGLAIVKHVCQNHGGEVIVDSVEGSGSRFTMRLPAAALPAAVDDSPIDEVPEPVPPGIVQLSLMNNLVQPSRKVAP